MLDHTPVTLPFGPISDREADAIAAHQARRAEREEQVACAAERDA